MHYRLSDKTLRLGTFSISGLCLTLITEFFVINYVFLCTKKKKVVITNHINHIALNLSTFQDYALRYWRDQGVPAEKIILGFAAYGRSFTLSSQSSEVGAPISGAGNAGRYTGERGLWSYYEVNALI